MTTVWILLSLASLETRRGLAGVGLPLLAPVSWCSLCVLLPLTSHDDRLLGVVFEASTVFALLRRHCPRMLNKLGGHIPELGDPILDILTMRVVVKSLL